MSRRSMTLLLLAAITSIAQFYPVTVHDNPPTSAEIVAPPEIRRILVRSCYDCHSNETRWPWYSYVAPASWLVAGDVHQARLRLNLSNWPDSIAPGVDCHFKRRIAERADKGEMPPLRYRLLHPSSELTAEDRTLLVIWAGEECAQTSGGASE